MTNKGNEGEKVTLFGQTNREQLQLAIEDSIRSMQPSAEEADEILDAITRSIQEKYPRFEDAYDFVFHIRQAKKCLDSIIAIEEGETKLPDEYDRDADDYADDPRNGLVEHLRVTGAL